MFTPAISVEMAKSDCVTCLPQPPFWVRRGARLNDAQNSGMLPTSVGGGSRNDGMLLASPASCGPGMVRPPGSVTLTDPSGGWSGLPNEAAWASVAAIAAPPAAVVAMTLRRDSSFITSFPPVLLRLFHLGSHQRETSAALAGMGTQLMSAESAGPDVRGKFRHPERARRLVRRPNLPVAATGSHSRHLATDGTPGVAQASGHRPGALVGPGIAGATLQHQPLPMP